MSRFPFHSLRLALASWLRLTLRQRRTQRVLLLLTVVSASAGVLDQFHVLDPEVTPAAGLRVARSRGPAPQAHTSSGHLAPEEAPARAAPAEAPSELQPSPPPPPPIALAPHRRAALPQVGTTAPASPTPVEQTDLNDSEAPTGLGPRDRSFAQASLPGMAGGGLREGAGFDDPLRPTARAQAATEGQGEGSAPPAPGPLPQPPVDNPVPPLDTLLPQGNVGQPLTTQLTPQVATVPEPPALLLLGSGLLLVGLRHWRQRRRPPAGQPPRGD